MPQRRERHTYDALDFAAFKKQPEEEKKEELPDAQMHGDGFTDVTHRLKQTKRNKTPANRD